MLSKLENQSFEKISITGNYSGWGATSFDAVDKMFKIDSKTFDAVIIEIGGNDFFFGFDGSSVEASEASTVELIESLQLNLSLLIDHFDLNQKYIFLAKLRAPIFMRKSYEDKKQGCYVDQFDKFFDDLCRSKKATEYLFCLNDFTKDLVASDFLFDKIHPNELGHKKIAQNVFNDLKVFFRSLEYQDVSYR
jgi:lysophospholipase L1-like esterase